jgi:hypothetical protein
LGKLLEARRARKLRRLILKRDPNIRREFREQRASRVPLRQRYQLQVSKVFKPLSVLFGLQGIAATLSGEGLGAAIGFSSAGFYAGLDLGIKPRMKAIRGELWQTGSDAIRKFSDSLDPAERQLLDRYSLLE